MENKLDIKKVIERIKKNMDESLMMISAKVLEEHERGSGRTTYLGLIMNQSTKDKILEALQVGAKTISDLERMNTMFGDDIKQLRIWIQEKDELIDSLKIELKSAYAKIDAVNLCSNLQGFKGREKS